MQKQYKVKLTHSLGDGEGLTYEIRIGAKSLDEAHGEALKRFKGAVSTLAATKSALIINKTKIEHEAVA